jgi:DNA-binding NarL/FixJ family response regulator
MSLRAVVVAHRQRMVAEGIAAALSRYPGIVPIGIATSAAEAEHWTTQVDAAAIDEELFGANTVAKRLRRHGVRVVFLGETPSSEDEGMKVSTGEPIEALATALVPAIAAVPRAPSVLTPREREVLGLVARGLAAKQVARHLGISSKTVEHHKTRIFAKLGVPNQTAAVGLALTADFGRTDAWSHTSI